MSYVYTVQYMRSDENVLSFYHRIKWQNLQHAFSHRTKCLNANPIKYTYILPVKVIIWVAFSFEKLLIAFSLVRLTLLAFHDGWRLIKFVEPLNMRSIEYIEQRSKKTFPQVFFPLDFSLPSLSLFFSLLLRLCSIFFVCVYCGSHQSSCAMAGSCKFFHIFTQLCY